MFPLQKTANSAQMANINPIKPLQNVLNVRPIFRTIPIVSKHVPMAVGPQETRVLIVPLVITQLARAARAQNVKRENIKKVQVLNPVKLVPRVGNPRLVGTRANNV